MSFTDRKLEMAMAGFAILMVVGMGHLLKSPVQTVLSEAEVIYEMPRPKSILASLFDLGDREISRDYNNPFANKQKVDVKKTESVPAKQAATPVAKKKADSKVAPTPIKKPTVEVNVVEADQAPAAFGEDVGEVGGRNSQTAQNTNNNKRDSTVVEETKNMMSGSQWRALLQAQPTQENVAKLVVAYGNGEVDQQTFYTIVSDLFSSNKVETQSLGLMALKSVYNERSFAMAAQFHDQLAAEVQPKVQAYLMSYAVSSRLNMLIASLRSGSAEVVTAATEVVIQGYLAAKSGANLNTNDPRIVRSDALTNSVTGYSKFVPIFQQLAQSQDSEIASMASAALSQMQTAVAVL